MRWGAKGPPRPPHASLLVLLAIPATLLRAPLSEEEREEGLRGGESARAGGAGTSATSERGRRG